ncbi:MAG TPA: ATP-binding protein [Hydrogenophaga sp.]|nr:ATP-binding protein [Hydrogenophaga sp.]
MNYRFAALEARNALVVYVDLWADRTKNPAVLVHDAVRSTLRELQTPGSRLLQRFKGLSLGAAGFSFGFQLERIGEPGGVTLAQAFDELVEKAKVNVVLIADEVQQTLGTEEGFALRHALKAARDAVNAKPGTPGRFLFIGTGSHKSLLAEMTSRRAQPFAVPLSASYQGLGQDFVQWQLDRIAAAPGVVLPSVGAAWQGFQTMGHRPEELLKALRQLQQAAGTDPDTAFRIICATLADAAADVELKAIDDLGELGKALFERIAAGGESGISGVFGADALAFYAERTGSPVETSQVQNIADKMVNANLVVRPTHGVYMVADPFVRKVWRDKLALTNMGSPGGASARSS